MLFPIINFAILFTGLILLIKRWLRDSRKESISDYCAGFDDFTKVYSTLNRISEWPGIKRVSIVRVSNKVITPVKGEKYFIKILYSKGDGAMSLLNNPTFLPVDDYYINFITSIIEKDSVLTVIKDLPDCELKTTCESVDLKEFYAFKIISIKNKLFCCTISTSEEGLLNKYAQQIEGMRIELLSIIRNNLQQE